MKVVTCSRSVGWSADFLLRNQAFLRAVLAPEQAIHAYHESSADGRLLLKVANIQSLPVELLGVSVGGGPLLPPATPMVLMPKRVKELPAYRDLSVRLETTLPLEEAASAHRMIEEGHTRGKIVLVM